jgi:hypothetical protein
MGYRAWVGRGCWKTGTAALRPRFWCLRSDKVFWLARVERSTATEVLGGFSLGKNNLVFIKKKKKKKIKKKKKKIKKKKNKKN